MIRVPRDAQAGVPSPGGAPSSPRYHSQPSYRTKTSHLERDKIRLCLFTPCLWSGGAEERMARVLAGADRREFEIAWMGFGPIREALIERAGPGVKVIALPRNPASGIEPGLIPRIAAALRSFRPDVMHILNWSTSFYGIAAARLARVPHVIYQTAGRETAEPPTQKRLTLMHVLAPYVDRFTTVCEYLGRELSESFGVPPDRVRVLRTGVDVERFDHGPSRDEARAHLGLPKDALVIGALSVLRPVKRIPDLIDAAAELARTRPDVHLSICGNALRMTANELRERADAHGLGDRFHLTGRVEEPDRVLPAFDIFVNCSLFEGSSNAIIEAMACRLPIVATRVGGSPELVDDGVNGLLVPPMSVRDLSAALGKLAADPELRARYGANGRKRVERRHTQRHMVESYLDLYRQGAKEGRSEALSSRSWHAIKALSDVVRAANSG